MPNIHQENNQGEKHVGYAVKLTKYDFFKWANPLLFFFLSDSSNCNFVSAMLIVATTLLSISFST